MVWFWLTVVIGAGLVLWGGVWWYFNSLLRPVHEGEVELMRRAGGKLTPDEPEYMGTFRIAQSEGDLLDSMRNERRAKAIFWAGVIVLLLCIGFRAWGCTSLTHEQSGVRFFL